LNNYAVSDAGATLSRFLVSVSVGSGYPLLFAAARSSALSLLRERRRGGGEKDRAGGGSDGVSVPAAAAQEGKAAPREENLSRILMGLITGAALVVPDAGFVVSLIGAVAGTAIIYVFPSVLFLRHFRAQRGWRYRLERAFCRFLIGFGAVSAVMGTVAAVLSSYYPALLQ
jgi:sodium-coupled neutral amino acid transporter 11